MANINKEQATHLDSIIKAAINNSEKMRSVRHIKENLLNDCSDEYCLSLYYILYNFSQDIIHPNSQTDIFWLTDYAPAFIHDGGFTSLYNTAFAKEEKERKKQERKDKADELDLQIKTWQVKTKYLPYIVSILALGVSIFTYFKPDKKQQDLQPMQQEIQELKQHVKSLDSLLQSDSLLKKHK